MDRDTMATPAAGAVFVQTNELQNRVLAFVRDEEGHLGDPVAHATGGVGTAEPHLQSQGSVVVSSDGRFLMIANAGSGDVSAFRVDGARLELLGVVASGGQAPRSIAERDGTVYVLNTGKPGIRWFRLNEAGLEPVAGGERPLDAVDADPAQVGIAPDGRTLVVTERGADSVVGYAVERDGSLGEPTRVESSGPTPYGFAFTSRGTLVVTEAFRAEKGAAAASSYALREGSLTPVTRSLGNGMSEICWAVVTPDDRFAFTTNFADGTISRYGIGVDGSLSLEDPAAASTGRPGLRDEDLTGDGRFLYAIDADRGLIAGWRVEGDGSLTAAGSRDGLPTTIAGLAAM